MSTLADLPHDVLELCARDLRDAAALAATCSAGKKALAHVCASPELHARKVLALVASGPAWWRDERWRDENLENRESQRMRFWQLQIGENHTP
jgi:hypothetical protein